MAEIAITVDGVPVSAQEGESVLSAAKRAGVFIPHLCYSEHAEGPSSACRVCYVMAEGVDAPVCACELPVSEGLSVRTDAPEARRLAAGAFKLLLAEHRISCGECGNKGNCLIISCAKALKAPLKSVDVLVREEEPEYPASDVIAIDYTKCIKCGRCVHACRAAGKGFFGFWGRGLDAYIAVDPAASSEVCGSCGACVRECPAGALAL